MTKVCSVTEAEIARIIREHHRTHVRQPSRTNEPRRTFHQGDKEAALEILAAVEAEAAKLREALVEAAKVVRLMLADIQGGERCDVYALIQARNNIDAALNPSPALVGDEDAAR